MEIALTQQIKHVCEIYTVASFYIFFPFLLKDHMIKPEGS